MSLAPPTLRALRVRPLMVPFRLPPASASGAMPTAPMVALDLHTEEGVAGHAYLFAFTPAVLKALVATLEALGELVRGEPLAPTELDAKLRRRFTLLDTPGILGLALAGLDMCAWDALARAAGLPLARVHGLGRAYPARTGGGARGLRAACRRPGVGRGVGRGCAGASCGLRQRSWELWLPARALAPPQNPRWWPGDAC